MLRPLLLAALLCSVSLWAQQAAAQTEQPAAAPATPKAPVKSKEVEAAPEAELENGIDDIDVDAGALPACTPCLLPPLPPARGPARALGRPHLRGGPRSRWLPRLPPTTPLLPAAARAAQPPLLPTPRRPPVGPRRPIAHLASYREASGLACCRQVQGCVQIRVQRHPAGRGSGRSLHQRCDR
jgi:hypothetical protein